MAGGGFGALDAMRKSIKYNLGLLRKTSAFENLKDFNYSKIKKRQYKFKKASPEFLARVKRQTIRRNRINFILRMILMGFSILFVAWIFHAIGLI